MAKRASAEGIKQSVIRLCHSGLDSRTLRVELLKHLRSTISFDYAYFSTTDPATQFATSAILVQDPPAWMMAVFLENEFLRDDFNKFSDMLKAHQTVGVLSASTGHELERSPRFREMLVPLAMGDELRAVFVSDSSCWGTLCVHRQPSRTGYTAAEADFLAQLAPHIADGLRKALLLGHIPTDTAPDAPGVLILSDDLSVIAMTAAAEYWLSELTEKSRDKAVLPLAVRSVVAALKAVERGIVTHPTPRIRLHTRSGHWLVLYASRLKDARDHGQITVIFETAQPSEIAPLIIQAYQLTKREGEVTQCILRGWSTSEIAAKLHISANTVQDHLKAIFEKVGVSSRGELAARIFTQQIQPLFQADTPLDAMGQFILK